MRTTRRTATPLAVACAALIFAGHAAAATSAGPDYDYAAPRAGPIAALADTDLLQVDRDGVDLQAGEFAWLPGSDARTDAPVTTLVSLSDQRAYVYRDGRRIAVTTVSTGKPGHDTPTGVFPIMGKEKMHHSNKYDNAPMPWMQRLTEWGHALHAGNVRPFPASHGCVRLPAEFARQLFSLTQRGDIVVISQDASARSLARAGVDSQVALLVGVTEPLPNIIRVPYREESTAGIAAQTGTAAVTTF